MIALDTNVLLRYLVRDDEEQTRRAVEAMDGASVAGVPLFVPQIVLCELVWVMARGYRFEREKILAVLDGLLHVSELVIEDRDTVLDALAATRHGRGDFSDYLIRARATRAGCTEVLTFDRALLSDRGFASP